MSKFALYASCAATVERTAPPYGARASGSQGLATRLDVRRQRNRAAADKFARDMVPVIEATRADGITSLEGIAAKLNMRGILTARAANGMPLPFEISWQG